MTKDHTVSQDPSGSGKEGLSPSVARSDARDAKSNVEGSGRAAVCIIPNCGRSAPADEPFCSRHRDARSGRRHAGREIAWGDAPLETPLWAVYGPECFPTVLACKIGEHPECSRAIWGFSIYEGVAAYRTLGRGEDWAKESGLRLFATLDAAFAHIAALFPTSAAP